MVCFQVRGKLRYPHLSEMSLGGAERHCRDVLLHGETQGSLLTLSLRLIYTDCTFGTGGGGGEAFELPAD